MNETLQGCRRTVGDCEAMVLHAFVVRRFTREEHERGDTAGWCFEGAWHQRASGLEWAWFQQEVDDGKTQDSQ